MGKISFFNIQEQLCNIQCLFSINDDDGRTYKIFKLADIGDIVDIKKFLMFYLFR